MNSLTVRSKDASMARFNAGIEEEAAARLADSPLLSLRRVDCSFRSGVLQLTGCVHSYYHKQVAQTLVAGIEGIQRIDNRIEVHHG